MASPAIEKLIESLDNDLPRSALLQEKIPALAAAFDAERMKPTLQDVLIGSTDGHYSIVQCVPGKALYLPDRIINMQYKLTILDSVANQTLGTLVNARLFQDAAMSKTYLDEILKPIAARMQGRSEIKPFANPVALIEPLNMTLSAFPIDGLIPTLVDATDPNKVAGILTDALPETLSGEFLIKDVRLLLAHYGPIGSVGATPSWWLESARRLEAAGYRAAWSWDHFVGGGVKTVPVVEQWTILGAAAGATSSLRLGTFITNVMNRHPAVVARMASTLQLASGGRFTLGIGIGGNPAEHRAYGIEFPEKAERADRLEEAIAVIRALWSGGPVSRPSPFYPLEGAHAFPIPEPAPRILVGAASPRGLRIAARLGDGWAAEIDDFERLLPTYDEALAAEGKARREAWIALGFGSGKSGRDVLPGSPWIEAPGETWARYAELGVDEVVVAARTTNDIDALVRAAERW